MEREISLDSLNFFDGFYELQIRLMRVGFDVQVDDVRYTTHDRVIMGW
jgi:hypothetical protein